VESFTPTELNLKSKLIDQECVYRELNCFPGYARMGLAVLYTIFVFELLLYARTLTLLVSLDLSCSLELCKEQRLKVRTRRGKGRAKSTLTLYPIITLAGRCK